MTILPTTLLQMFYELVYHCGVNFKGIMQPDDIFMRTVGCEWVH